MGYTEAGSGRGWREEENRESGGGGGLAFYKGV
jgi:hypothetical protein